MADGGIGSEAMQRIAAPMVRGMITTPLLPMFVIPAAYLLMRRTHTARVARVRFQGESLFSTKPKGEVK